MQSTVVVLLAVAAFAQAFDMTPWCTTLVGCEETVLKQYNKCMGMARVLAPDTVGATECETKFWMIINTVMDTRYNDTMMFINCMKTSDPGMYPTMPDEMMTTCTTTMSSWPTWSNWTYPEVVDHLFKRVGAEMTTFMSFFPANTDFTQCIMDAFYETKRCYPVMDCCTVASPCRETLSIAPATVTLNRVFNMMHSFNAICKTTTDFSEDTAPIAP